MSVLVAVVTFMNKQLEELSKLLRVPALSDFLWSSEELPLFMNVNVKE